MTEKGAIENAEMSMEEALKRMEELSLSLVALKFGDSLASLSKDNIGRARDFLRIALTGRSLTRVNADDFDTVLFVYIKNLFKARQFSFIKESLGIIVSELGEEYGQLLKPFSIALEYMQTKDVSILERCQVEVRKIVLEIAGEEL